MEYPLEKVLETRILQADDIPTLNRVLVELQANNDTLNGSYWKPASNIVVADRVLPGGSASTEWHKTCYTLLVNRVRIKTF